MPCHYGEQNGDLMRDPDMTFEIAADGRWLPVSFRNDYVGKDQEAIWQDEKGTILCRPRLVMELQSFARTSNKNIAEQGFVQAARRRRKASLAARCRCTRSRAACRAGSRCGWDEPSGR